MRNRPEAILERRALVRLSKEAPEITVFRNEVGHGHPRVVGKLIERALEQRWPDALDVVEAILVRNRITWGLGVGSPDLVIVRGGIELKVPGAYPKPEQRACHEAWRRAGLRVEVARTEDEVIEAARRIVG